MPRCYGSAGAVPGLPGGRHVGLPDPFCCLRGGHGDRSAPGKRSPANGAASRVRHDKAAGRMGYSRPTWRSGQRSAGTGIGMSSMLTGRCGTSVATAQKSYRRRVIQSGRGPGGANAARRLPAGTACLEGRRPDCTRQDSAAWCGGAQEHPHTGAWRRFGWSSAPGPGKPNSCLPAHHVMGPGPGTEVSENLT